MSGRSLDARVGRLEGRTREAGGPCPACRFLAVQVGGGWPEVNPACPRCGRPRGFAWVPDNGREARGGDPRGGS